jgi:DoxX-like family
MLLTLRIATALVWVLFGLVFKVLQVVPRHEAIVATVLGNTVAAPVTLLIGLAETAMGIWILSQWRPRTCAAAQTIAIVTMNALELSLARDQLLAPLPMVCANILFLAVGWYLALHTPGQSRPP